MASTSTSTTDTLVDQPSGSAYTCPFFSCDLWVAQDAASFKIHTLLHHPNAYSLPCAFCSETFEKVEGVISHIDQCHKEPKLVVTFRSYQCGFQDCWMACESAPDFLTHNQKAHPYEKSFVCCYCKCSHNTLAELVLHIDENVIYSCVACPNVTRSSYTNIKKHIMNSEHGSQMSMATDQVDTAIKLQIKCAFSNESGEIKYKAIERIIHIQKETMQNFPKTSNSPSSILEEENDAQSAPGDSVQTLGVSSGTCEKSDMRDKGKKDQNEQKKICDTIEAEGDQEQSVTVENGLSIDKDAKPKTEQVLEGAFDHAQNNLFAFLGKGELLKCDQCTFQTEMMKIKEIHDKVHLSPQGLNKMLCCPHCPYSTDSLASYKIHVQCHTEKARIRIYNCSYCSYSSIKMDLVEDHHEEVHGDLELKSDVIRLAVQNMRFECYICAFSSVSEAELIDHLEKKHKRFSVQTYLKENYNIEGLEDAVTVEAKNGKKCRRRELRIILQRVDLKIKPEAGSGQLMIKQEPMDVDDNTLKFDLKNITHSGSEEFTCDFCSFSTSQKAKLEEHWTVHEGQSILGFTDTAENVHIGQFTTTYVGECNYSTQTMQLLNQAIVSVSSENLMMKHARKCPLCPSSSTSRNILLMHLNRHQKSAFYRNGYKCGYCEYITEVEGSLTKHIHQVHPRQSQKKITIGAAKLKNARELLHAERPIDGNGCEKGSNVPNQQNAKPTSHTLPDAMAAAAYISKSEEYVPDHGARMEFTAEIVEVLNNRIAEILRWDVDVPYTGPTKCPICPFKTTKVGDRSSIKSHLETHVVQSAIENGWRCGYCLYTSANLSAVTKHLRVYHRHLPPKRITLGDISLVPKRGFARGTFEYVEEDDETSVPSNTEGYDGTVDRSQRLEIKNDRLETDAAVTLLPEGGKEFEYTEEIMQQIRDMVAELDQKDQPYTGPNKCLFCPYKNLNYGRKSLREHVIKHIAQAAMKNGWRCGYCLYTCENRTTVRLHLNKYHNKLPASYVALGEAKLVPETESWNVNFNNAEDYVPEDLTPHMYTEDVLSKIKGIIAEVKESQVKEEPYTGTKACPACPYDTAPDRWALRGHLETHLGMAAIVNGWRCSYCLYTAEKGHAVTLHMRSFHVDQPVRRIVLGDPTLIPPETASKNTPTNNMEECTLPEDASELQYTEDVLKMLNDRIAELKEHDTGKLYTGSLACPICPFKNAGTPCAIRNHIETHVASAALKDGWRCGYCLFTCVIPGGVTSHLKKYHARYVPKRIRIGNPKTAPPLFAPTNDSDEEREETYTEYNADRKYTEEILKKLKERIDQLQGDKSQYTGSRRCMVCPYRCSSDRGALRTHLESHVAQAAIENGWKCVYCLYISDHRGAMTTHTKKYHGNLPLQYVTFGNIELINRRANISGNLKRSGRTSRPVKRLIDDVGEYGDEKQLESSTKRKIPKFTGSATSTASHGAPMMSKADYTQGAMDSMDEYTRSLYCRKDEQTDIYNCINCSFSDNIPARVYSHFCLEHREDCPFQCGYCDYRSVAMVTIGQHCEMSHSGLPVKGSPVIDTAPQSDQIDSETVNIDGLSTYMIVCADDIYMCSICGLEYTGRENVKQHLLTAHLNEYAFKCKHCEFASSEARKVEEHIAKVHPALESAIMRRDSAPPQSDLPQSETSEDQTVADPQDIFKLQRRGPCPTPADWIEPQFDYEHDYRCAECSYSSKWQTIHMKVHVVEKHLLLRKNSCRYCAFGGYTRGEMDYHYKHVHPGKPANAVEDWEVMQTALYVKSVGKLVYVGLSEHADVVRMTFKPNITYFMKKPLKQKPIDLPLDQRRHSSSSESQSLSSSLQVKAGVSPSISQQPSNEAPPVYQCTVCNETRPEKSQIQHHITVEHLYMNPYVCQRCPFGAKTQGEVESHSMYEHPMERVGVRFEFLEHPAVQAYIAVIQTQLSKKVPSLAHTKPKIQRPKSTMGHQRHLLCKMCSTQCLSAESLSEHMASNHTDYNGFRCNYCGMYNKSKSQMRGHFEDKHPNQEISLKRVTGGVTIGNSFSMSSDKNQRHLLCKMCNTQCLSADNLSEHMATNHTDYNGFRCNYCGVYNKCRSQMRDHFKSKHPNQDIRLKLVKGGVTVGNTLNSFSMTRKRNSTDSPAMKHDRSGEQRQLFCKLCSTQCLSAEGLSEHMASEHRNYNGFRCNHCGVHNKSKYQMRDHFEVKHPNQQVRYQIIKRGVALGNTLHSLGVSRYKKTKYQKIGFASIGKKTLTALHKNTPIDKKPDIEALQGPPESNVRGIKETNTYAEQGNIYASSSRGKSIQNFIEEPQIQSQHTIPSPLTLPERQVQSHYRDSNSPIYASETHQSLASESSCEKNEVFICILCGDYRNGRTDCLHHIMYELEYRPWSCPHCTFTDVTLLNVKRHCFSAHPGREFHIVIKKDPEKMMKIHSLLESSRVSTTQKGDAVHVSTEEETQRQQSFAPQPSHQVKTEVFKLLQCTYCPATASDFDELSQHMATEHGKSRQFGDNQLVNREPVIPPQPRIKQEFGHRPTEDVPHVEQLTVEPISIQGSGQGTHYDHSHMSARDKDDTIINIDDNYEEDFGSGIHGDSLPESVTEGYIGMFDGMVVTDKDLRRESARRFSCRKCTHASEKDRAVSHYVRNHGPLRWKCPYCNFKNSITHFVRRHIKAKHADLPVFVVPVDPTSNVTYPQHHSQPIPPHAANRQPPSSTLSKRPGLTGSSAANTGENQRSLFCCFQCSFKTDDTAELIVHQRQHSSASASCNPAPIRNVRAYNSSMIMNSQSSTASIECPHCSYMAWSIEDLRQHNSQKHHFVRPYKCGHCDFSAFTHMHVQKHCENRHPDKPEWVVDQVEVADAGVTNAPRTSRKRNSTGGSLSSMSTPASRSSMGSF